MKKSVQLIGLIACLSATGISYATKAGVSIIGAGESSRQTILNNQLNLSCTGNNGVGYTVRTSAQAFFNDLSNDNPLGSKEQELRDPNNVIAKIAAQLDPAKIYTITCVTNSVSFTIPGSQIQATPLPSNVTFTGVRLANCNQKDNRDDACLTAQHISGMVSGVKVEGSLLGGEGPVWKGRLPENKDERKGRR
ncbi:MAG: hypothetical protein K0S08_2219 [Gammaproteobacteria bacterium]|jgi:hypothetical protein|nr:hypothetical protein [Gammaproteobacteria bacterium]